MSTVTALQPLDAYARKNNSSDFEILVDGVALATISPDRKWAEYRVYFMGTGTDQVITLRELAAQNDSRGTIIDVEPLLIMSVCKSVMNSSKMAALRILVLIKIMVVGN